MTKKRIVEIRCEKCNESHEIEVYDVIDPNDTPEARQTILYNRLFEIHCPSCGAEYDKMFPFWYIDDVHNFKIQFAPRARLLEYQIPSDSKYIEVGCFHLNDMVSKIICLENGLDYVAETIVEQLIQDDFDEKKKERKTNIELLFLIEDYEAENIGLLYMELNEDGKPKFEGFDFPIEIYEGVLNKIKDIRNDKFNYYIFDRDAALKFLAQDVNSDCMVELMILHTYYGGEMVIFNPPYNEGKYEIGDVVVAYDEETLIQGKIHNILRENYKYSPFIMDELPYLLYKTNSFTLESKKDSDYVLNNEELKKVIFKDNKIKASMIMNSNVILAVKFGLPVNELGYADKTKAEFSSTYDGNKRYLNIYLENEAVDITSTINHIYNFDDVINMVLNDPFNFDGIYIKALNGEKRLEHTHLYEYKKNRVMTVFDSMKELLFNLKPSEIEYLGQQTYDLISCIYYTDSKLEDIEKHFGLTHEETNELLDEGYYRLGQIVTCNY